MRKFIEQLGGRKAFAFYSLSLVSIFFLTFWHGSETFNIDFKEWVNFELTLISIYVFGNLGEHAKDVFNKKVEKESDKDGK